MQGIISINCENFNIIFWKKVFSALETDVSVTAKQIEKVSSDHKSI